MQKSKITIKIPLKKITPLLKKHQSFILAILILLFVSGMSLGAFLSINPANNKEAVQKGEEKIKSLNIYFDKKTLEDIQKEQGSAVIQGSAGRNPFAPY